MRATRWHVLYGCLMVQFVIGTLYGWGNDTVYVTSWLRRWQPDLLYRDTLFTLGSATISLSVSMIPSGIFVDRWPHRMQWMVGLFSFLFCVVVALVVVVRSNWQLLLVSGCLRGVTIGVAHIGPMVASQKWFPDHLNLINGAVGATFGLSSFVFNFVTTALINPDNLSREDPLYGVQDPADNKYYFRTDSPVVGRVERSFLILSGIYFVLVVPAGFLTITPDSQRHYRDLDEEDGKKGTGQHHVGTALVERYVTIPVRDAVCGWHLWFVCLLLVLVSMPGHIVFAVYKTYAKGMDDQFLTLVGSIGALGNAGGRLFWGGVADRLARVTGGRGEKWAVVLLAAVQAGFLATFGLPFVLENKAWFLIWTVVVKTCYGGCFAVFPSMTCKMFGIGNFGALYGIVSCAWGSAGLAGDTLVNQLEQHIEAVPFFLSFAALSLAGLLLATLHRFPYLNDPDRLREAQLRI